MTKNEAIKELETSIELAKMCTQNSERKIEIEAYKTAIQALEEIQQYRAIGTVEDWQKLIKKEATERRKLEEYFMLGSVDEFKALKEKSVAKKANNVERKRDENGFIYQIGECPCCCKLVTDDRECCDCMQKLDWSR